MSEKRSGRLEEIRDLIKKPYDEIQADTKKAGKLQYQMGELTWAKQVKHEIMVFATNRSLSIDDRVEKMKMMVELLASMAKAKPNNYLWAELYNSGYLPEMQFWELWKGMRQFYGVYTVVEIEEYVEKKEKQRDEKGTEKTVDRSGWNRRTVDPTTALELWLKQPESEGEGGAAIPGMVHVLRTIKMKGADSSTDMPYTEDFIEKQIVSFGENETIPVILSTCDFIFNEFNVPVNTILMLNAMMQPQQGSTALHIQAHTEEGQNSG